MKFFRTIASQPQFLAAATFLVATTAAAVPRQLNHQGWLTTLDGTPVEGEHLVRYGVHDAAAAGHLIWEEQQVVSFAGGAYSAILGLQNPIDENVLGPPGLYLSITIDGDELLPRHAIVSAPYAVMAASVQGGPVDATSIAINGTPVIGSDGSWVGPVASGDPLASYACASGDTLTFSSDAWSCTPMPHTLDRLACNPDQLPRWTGAAWTCSDDADTRYTAGPGIDIVGGAIGATLGASIDASEIVPASVLPEHLADAGCAEHEGLHWIGNQWRCAEDANTRYSAGAGLELNATTFSLPSLCADGQVLKKNAAAWVCAADTDTNTTYSAGPGLELNSTTLSLPSSCTTGQVLKKSGASWVCATDIDTDTNTTYSAGAGLLQTGTTFSLALQVQTFSNESTPRLPANWNKTGAAVQTALGVFQFCAVSYYYTPGDGDSICGVGGSAGGTWTGNVKNASCHVTCIR